MSLGKWFGSRKVRHLEHRLALLDARLQAVQSRIDVPDALVEEFQRDRLSDEYQAVYRTKQPLVSVCVSTYHKPDLLLERCLGSLLEQTYSNIEIIVIGDCCTDDTSERVASISDRRIRYENLSQRGPYPEDPRLRWMVAGTPAVNRALSVARGDFITHLDHDDSHPPKRVEQLVEFTQNTGADLVFHPFHRQSADGSWKLQRAEKFAWSHVTTSSVFYHRWFGRIHWDPFAYRLEEPGDWNRLRRIKHLGARIERFPEPLLRHYAEQTSLR